MAKIGTAHQPNYLPWIGFFSKIQCSEYFIIADIFDMGDQSFLNRNRVRITNGWVYLTVPVGHKSARMKICDILLPADKSWQKNHWQTICNYYSKTEFFKDHRDYFEELYHKDFKYLWQLNMAIINYLLKCFKIEAKVLKASEMEIDHSLPTTESIIAMMNKAGVDIYLSGPSGRNYLELKKFPQKNLNVRFFKFEHPIYKQNYHGFEPNMSAIDLLFNMGPRAIDLIKASGTIE